MEAAERDRNARRPERPRDIERARILVGLHADQPHHAEIAVRARSRRSSFGTLTRVLVSSMTSISISTSAPRTRRSAQSVAMPYTAASEFDGMSARHHRIT